MRGRPSSKEGQASVRGSKQITTENQNKNKTTERNNKTTPLTSNSIHAWLTGRKDQRQRSTTPTPTVVETPQAGEPVNPCVRPNGPNTEAPNTRTGLHTHATLDSTTPAPSPLQVGGGEGQSRYDYSGPRWLDGRWRDDKDVEGPAAGSFITVVGLQVDGAGKTAFSRAHFYGHGARGEAGRPAGCNF